MKKKGLAKFSHDGFWGTEPKPGIWLNSLYDKKNIYILNFRTTSKPATIQDE